MTRPRMAIVGGGIAGTAAALACSRGGAEVTLLESRGRLGGAVYSFARDGFELDNGQHVFLRCCEAYRSWLAEIGAASMVTIQPRLAIPVLAPGGRRAWLRRSGLPAPMHLAGSVLRYPYLGLGERIGVARAMQSLRGVDVDDAANDDVSFGDWLREHHQGPRAVGAIWELIVRPTINLRAEEASLAQAAQVFQVGLLSDAAAADVGYATVPLSEVHDRAARRALAAAGVTVRLRSGVTGVARDGDRGFRLGVGRDGPPLHADAVVLAVPPRRALALLPEGSGVEAQSLGELGSSPIVNLHAMLDRRVLDVPFAAAIDSPLQWLFDRSGSSGAGDGHGTSDRGGSFGAPEGRGQYLAVTLSAADEELSLSADELRGRCLNGLRELLPAARDARLERFLVTREHAATFRAVPGARARRPAPRTAIPGLVLAGAWTDTGWPATMEGAVRSGRAAAGEALAALARCTGPSGRAVSPAAARGVAA